MTTAAQTPAIDLRVVPIGDVFESPFNTRTHFNEAKMRDLENSVRSSGVMTPLLVRPVGKRFELAAGHRRLRAAQTVGVAELPISVRLMTDSELRELLMIENLQREDVHPLDEAQGYAALIQADRAYNAAIVAAKVGKSESYVYRRLKLLELIPIVRRAFEGERMTVAHAERLSRLSPDLQHQAYESELYHPAFMFAEREQDESLTQPERLEHVLPNADALRPLANLDAFIRKHSAVKPHDPETQHYFPEIARAAAGKREADEDFENDLRRAADEDVDAVPAPARLLELSESHFVRQDLGLDKTAAAPLSVTKWHAIKNAKDRCPHAERGVVVHGGEQRVIPEVCATKGCPKHFPLKKKTSPKQSASTAAAEADARQRQERERQRQEDERKAWTDMSIEAFKAFAAHAAKVKVNTGFVRTIVASHQLRDIEKLFDVVLSDATAAQVLLLSRMTNQMYGREVFGAAAGAWGWNLKAFEKNWREAQTAKGQATLKDQQNELKAKGGLTGIDKVVLCVMGRVEGGQARFRAAVKKSISDADLDAMIRQEFSNGGHMSSKLEYETRNGQLIVTRPFRANLTVAKVRPIVRRLCASVLEPLAVDWANFKDDKATKKPAAKKGKGRK